MIPKHDFDLIRKGFQEGKTQEQICEDLIADRKARGITRGIKDVSHTVSKLSKTSAKYVGYVRKLKTYYRKEEILKRIMDIRGVVRKIALRVLKYLDTVDGKHNDPGEGNEMIRISKGLSHGDERVYYVFYDETSPTFVAQEGEDYDPIFWRTMKSAPIYYKEVLEETLTFEDIESHFFDNMDFERGRLDPDTLVLLGLAVYDQP